MKYKNYFPLPNEIFSLGLSSGEIAVYAFLMYCDGKPFNVIRVIKRLLKQSA